MVPIAEAEGLIYFLSQSEDSKAIYSTQTVSDSTKCESTVSVAVHSPALLGAQQCSTSLSTWFWSRIFHPGWGSILWECHPRAEHGAEGKPFGKDLKPNEERVKDLEILKL